MDSKNLSFSTVEIINSRGESIFSYLYEVLQEIHSQ